METKNSAQKPFSIWTALISLLAWGLALFLAFAGGSLLPLGFVILLPAVLIGIGTTILALRSWVKYKKPPVNLLLLPLIVLAFYFGLGYDQLRTGLTVAHLRALRAELILIQEKEDRSLLEADLEELRGVYGDFHLEFYSKQGDFSVHLKDGSIFSEAREVLLRPRP
jgi:hypothetical protein